VPISFTVTEKAMRPASDRRRCFYCQQPIGEPHKPGCVLVKKRVKMRMTVEYEVEVPAAWGKEQIEFHRNASSWCANNAISELEEYFDDEARECMCGSSEFDYLGGDTPPYLHE